jgi:pimeloyl-ACP methyl ester carboxylesterase
MSPVSKELLMPQVTSADGTTIAYERTGAGPALVLVDGALCHRAAGPMRLLAALLRDRFTVYAYDRRGRGESGDTPPYAVGREIEDLRAVLAEAGEAYVYGISSGAALALAAAGPRMIRLALYEPPFLGADAEYTARLTELLVAGRRGDAVALFMTHVGVPEQAVAGIRRQPGWAALEAIAPTLAYDDAVLARGPAMSVTVPTLVLSGGASPDGLQRAAKATLPEEPHRTLDGETHDVAPEALAPILSEFFGK